jgi:IclR family KDG regulon transcriptional repressor
LLAWGEQNDVQAILAEMQFTRSTENTLMDVPSLVKVLEQVREQGYGEDNEEQEQGLRCIAVPVFDRFGVVVAGLSISFPTIRFSEESKQDYVAMLHTAARNISEQLGYHDYPF